MVCISVSLSSNCNFYFAYQTSTVSVSEAEVVGSKSPTSSYKTQRSGPSRHSWWRQSVGVDWRRLLRCQRWNKWNDKSPTKRQNAVMCRGRGIGFGSGTHDGHIIIVHFIISFSIDLHSTTTQTSPICMAVSSTRLVRLKPQGPDPDRGRDRPVQKNF